MVESKVYIKVTLSSKEAPKPEVVANVINQMLLHSELDWFNIEVEAINKLH